MATPPRTLLNSRKAWLAAAALLVGLAVLSQVRVVESRRPAGRIADLASLREREDVNVLFILIDTLRADRLSAYGYERPTSPGLDALAATGIRFARVEAQSSWTKCSMASLWTGLYPRRSGILRFDHALPDAAILASERFQEAGFRTAGIIRNGWVAPNFGFGQGFDLYMRPTPSRTPEKVQRAVRGGHALRGTDLDATEAALEFLRASGEERFLLYVHYMDVHQYLYDQVAAGLRFGTSYSDAYDSSIHWVDRHVGRLLGELDDLDLARRTVVVVASDHGEGFYEHGHEGHARTLYREVTHVPLFLGLPFRLEEPLVVDALVRNVDIWPTVLDLLGLESLPATDGQSLVPLIEASASGAPTEDFAPEYARAYLDRNWGRTDREPDPLLSIRSGRERLVLPLADPARAELYDHESDPTEQHDIAAQATERAERLGALAQEPLAAGPWGDSPRIEIDGFRLEQLRALGYAVP